MILIKNVEVIEAKGDQMYLAYRRYPNDYMEVTNNGKEDYMLASKFYTEMVEGHRFMSRTHGQVSIGASKEIQDLLRIPMDCFEQIETKNRELTESLRNRSSYIKEIQSYGFFKRLKCLFKGIK